MVVYMEGRLQIDGLSDIMRYKGRENKKFSKLS